MIYLSLAIILASFVIANAIKKLTPEGRHSQYTVSPPNTVTQAEIIKRQDPLKEFLNKTNGTK